MTVALRPPEGDQSGFPRASVEGPLWRVHQQFDADGGRRSPWHFGSAPAAGDDDPGGRFDLEAPRGTLYTGETIGAAVTEVVRNLPVVTPEFLARRSVSLLTPDEAVDVADLTAEAAFALGITAEVGTVPDYEVPRQWAAALDRAGHAGLRSFARHHPGRDATVSLFGRAGEHPPDAGAPWTVRTVPMADSAEVADAFAHLGLRVLDRPVRVPTVSPATG